MTAAQLTVLVGVSKLPDLMHKDFLSSLLWRIAHCIEDMSSFLIRNLDREMEGNTKRWKMYCECEAPEKEKLPGDWKNRTNVQQLCIQRALRPDRMTHAIRLFIEEKMGKKYVDVENIDFTQSYEESGPSTPIFFILSPGVNPLTLRCSKLSIKCQDKKQRQQILLKSWLFNY
ncbi:unnamed protein product, partial [Meganyctiphanes norvegica]